MKRKSTYEAKQSTLEVPPGYKKTEVGVIPEDWEVKQLGSCLSGRPDYGINAAAVPFSDKLPTYIRITDITEDGRFSPERLVSVQSAHSDLYYLHDGDIVFARTGASVGKSYRYDPSDGRLVFAGFLIRVRPNPKQLSSQYLSACVTTDYYWKWVRLMSTRSGQPGINGNEYAQLPVPCPPIEEQQVIASALSDMDGLLLSLNTLVAKKRDLKQATMQQLLSGEQRLPGFKGQWHNTTLGEIGDCVIGLTYTPDQVVEHGLLVLRSSNIENNQLSFTDKVYVSAKVPEKLITRAGDILVCVRNGSRSLIGKCAKIDEDAAGLTFGAFMSVYRTKYSDFIFHVFQSSGIQRQIHENIGATINQITSKDMRSFRVKLPPVEEQTAIAKVLSDMDAEIAALEAQRDKTAILKQAMMQELLTGRTRLI